MLQWAGSWAGKRMPAKACLTVSGFSLAQQVWRGSVGHAQRDDLERPWERPKQRRATNGPTNSDAVSLQSFSTFARQCLFLSLSP